MRDLKINGAVVKSLAYYEIPTLVKIYKKYDNSGYEVYTWLADEYERISGNSDNIELLYIKLMSDNTQEVIRGEIFEGLDLGKFTDQDRLDYFKEKKKKEIASDRYNEEISGVNVNGIEIDTERDSQALITGAALAAFQDNTYTLKWKAKGGFIVLNASEVIQIANFVREHVQKCFNREAECIELINNANSIEELDSIKY